MTRRLRLTSILSLALSLALLTPAFALTLPEVISCVEGRSSVMNARTELADARINLERVQRDPLAIRADLLQAEQRLDLAAAELGRTRASTRAELVSAYTGVLGAERQLELAQASLTVSKRAREITLIRLESGSATEQERRDAEAVVDEAAGGVRSAQEGRDLALNTLSGLLGEAVEPGSLAGIPPSFFTAVPPLEAVRSSAQGHPDLLTAQQQAALAQLGSEVLDPLYAPQSEIESASSQLQAAQTGVRETARGFFLQLQSLHSQAKRAREALTLGNRALETARSRLATERQRLEGGLISRLEFEQAALESNSAAAEAQSARIAYLSALLELQSGSLVPLGGPFGTVMSPAMSPAPHSADLTSTDSRSGE